MRKKHLNLWIGLIVSITMFGADSLAAADQQGETGHIRSIHLRSDSASSSAFWNWVVIAGASGDQAYYWGGSVCPGKRLHYVGSKDTMVDALAEYATFPDMCITPFFKNGQGGYRCLVTFTAAIRQGQECDLRPQ